MENSRGNFISENSIVFAVTIVIHKSRNLIGTLGSSEFGPKAPSMLSFTNMEQAEHLCLHNNFLNKYPATYAMALSLRILFCMSSAA